MSSVLPNTNSQSSPDQGASNAQMGDSQQKAPSEHDRLWEIGTNIAQALSDLSDDQTDLGQSKKRAQGARETIKDLKSAEQIGPALREAVIDQINKIVSERYKNIPQASQIADALDDRVAPDGTIDDSNLDQLDQETLSGGAQERLAGLGVAPSARKTVVAEPDQISYEKDLADQYQNTRQALKVVDQGRPDLKSLPADPAELAQTAVEKTAKAGSEDSMSVAGMKAAQRPQIAAQMTHVSPKLQMEMPAILRQTRRAEGKKAGQDQAQLGSGHWQEPGEQPKEADTGAAAPPSEGALPSGRVPRTSPQAGKRPVTAGPPPGSPLGSERGEDLASARRRNRKERHQQVMQSLPSAIASGQISNLAEMPGASGMKDENNQNLDLDQNLTDYTGSNNEDTAIDSSEKELDTIENQEAKAPEEKGKSTKSQKEEQYKRNVRKAKLAAGLQKIVKKHQNTNWFMLFAVAAFRDLLSCFEFGFLIIIFGPIQFFCQLYKKIALAGRESSNDNAVGWVTTTIKSVPILDSLPAALAEIARIHSASWAKMIKAQKQLERLQRK